MADSTEMLRLMQHAADRLDEENEYVEDAFRTQLDAARRTVDSDGIHRAASRHASYVAASTLAQTVLRMVAACMADEPSTIAEDVHDIVDAAVAWRQVEEGDDRDVIRAAAHQLGLAVDAFSRQERGDGE